MGLNLAQKIIQEHLVEGEMVAGRELALRIDHVLMQDSLGMIAFLYFEAMGIPRVKSKLCVLYVDHTMLQLGVENADDQRFMRSAAARWGIHYSRPGNGICHQVHLERFSEPGATMLGSDSHTPTSGAVGMLAIGAGSLDVAVAMGGGPFYVRMPKVVRVNLTGRLQPWVAGKDVILELLRRLSVKGGVDRIFEFAGDGVASLSVPDRGTICNMGTELGATTSLFPSDEVVRSYLEAQQRGSIWKPLAADSDAAYDEEMEIDLSSLEPLIACPSSPDAVVPVREVEGTRVDQVCVGSCTNSSLADLEALAAVLKGKTVPPSVNLTVTPGSRQVLQMIARSGALGNLIDSGARILEAACGPCIGMGQLPGAEAVSLRTFNRNFPGRSGATPDRVYLCSPQVAAASALTGQITDPRRLGDAPPFDMPERFPADDAMVIPPASDPDSVEIVRPASIKPLPLASEPPETLRGVVLLKTGDNISTDHIVPTGAKVLPPRHNIPALSDYAFQRVDDSFPRRAREAGGGFIVGGSNYGQGSSREYAALVPMHLGVKAVLALSFARIHWANLVNVGILPLTFADLSGYSLVEQGDVLELAGVREGVAAGRELVVRNVTRGVDVPVKHDMTPRQVQVYLDGGMMNHIGKRARG